MPNSGLECQVPPDTWRRRDAPPTTCLIGTSGRVRQLRLPLLEASPPLHVTSAPCHLLSASPGFSFHLARVHIRSAQTSREFSWVHLSQAHDSRREAKSRWAEKCSRERQFSAPCTRYNQRPRHEDSYVEFTVVGEGGRREQDSYVSEVG